MVVFFNPFDFGRASDLGGKPRSWGRGGAKVPSGIPMLRISHPHIILGNPDIISALDIARPQVKNHPHFIPPQNGGIRKCFWKP